MNVHQSRASSEVTTLPCNFTISLLTTPPGSFTSSSFTTLPGSSTSLTLTPPLSQWKLSFRRLEIERRGVTILPSPGSVLNWMRTDTRPYNSSSRRTITQSISFGMTAITKVLLSSLTLRQIRLFPIYQTVRSSHAYYNTRKSHTICR